MLLRGQVPPQTFQFGVQPTSFGLLFMSNAERLNLFVEPVAQLSGVYR